MGKCDNITNYIEGIKIWIDKENYIRFLEIRKTSNKKDQLNIYNEVN